ncbi:hypothetical protein [Hamadaea tsunoensis]|uniref:hypothetical protein n=1 Tax=Hamadaea tsunoensis TaxID=53368 RepID=UPI000403E09B|nr:hypothetical protein [Hamadaea tsunoensis]
MRKLLLALAVAAAAVTLGPTPPVAAAGPAACTGTIVITGLAFNPASIAAGGTSTATLAAANCTSRRQQVTATWVGRFANASSGPAIPQGCPALDPLNTPLDFPPGGALTRSVTYLVFKDCTAAVLHLTVTIANGVQVLATRSADLQITH